MLVPAAELHLLLQLLLWAVAACARAVGPGRAGAGVATGLWAPVGKERRTVTGTLRHWLGGEAGKGERRCSTLAAEVPVYGKKGFNIEKKNHLKGMLTFLQPSLCCGLVLWLLSVKRSSEVTTP